MPHPFMNVQCATCVMQYSFDANARPGQDLQKTSSLVVFFRHLSSLRSSLSRAHPASNTMVSSAADPAPHPQVSSPPGTDLKRFHRSFESDASTAIVNSIWSRVEIMKIKIIKMVCEI